MIEKGKKRAREIVYRLLRFVDVVFGITDLRLRVGNVEWQQGQLLLRSLLTEPRSCEPLRLLQSGYKIYSQNDEDGIIAEILKRIGTDSKFFIEIGVENGSECNTRALLYSGWRGVWVEASSEHVAVMNRTLPDQIAAGDLEIIPEFVTRAFATTLQKRWPALEGVDLFSIDIDGNDFHIIEAMEQLRPRLIIVEYNAKFRPPLDWVMPYNEGHMWDGTDYYGASLTAWNRLLSNKGYVLVGCNINGTNAFFVRTDLAAGKFSTPYTAENHYEPARYWLGTFRSGHRPKVL